MSPGVSSQVVAELITFAKQLQNYGASNNMPDIENVAQALSGTAAKTKVPINLVINAGREEVLPQDNEV